MSRTIEAIMRHMTVPSNRTTNQQWNREAEEGIHGKEAALHLVGIQIRPRHDAVSLQRACSLQQHGSGRQKCP